MTQTRTAFVTGATAGIGEATVRTLVANGCATRDLPDPLGGAPLPAAELHRVTLAALNDRFATVVPDASVWHN